MVSASAWEFRRFGPFDLRIEWLYGRVDVSSIEGRVGASEGDDGAGQVGVAPIVVSFRGLVHPTGSRTVTIVENIRSLFILSMT